MIDSYAPGVRIRCEDMEVDHLISLREAWESGVCGDDLKALAKDPRNLRFTYWKTNRSKGRMPALEFANRLDGRVARLVEDDALILMKHYGILSHREALERRYLARLAQIPATRIPFSVLKAHSIEHTIKKVGGKTVVFVGKRIVGTVVIVGSVYTAIELSSWAYGSLFLPSGDSASSERAARFKKVIDEFD